VLAFYTEHTIGWLFLGWLAVGTPLNLLLARRRVPLGAMAQREDTRVRARVIDVLTNIGAVHEFARRTFELESLSAMVTERYRVGLRSWRSGEIARIWSNVLQLFFVGGIMAATVYAWQQGAATAGDIVLIISLVGGLGYRMEELGREINDFAETYGEISEGLEDIINPHDIEDKPGAEPLHVAAASVSFENVSFIYKEGISQVMQDFSLEIPAGQKVGLVGRSGAGKSTLVRLLLRHYELASGEIKIGSTNIAKVTQDSLRETIGVVPQEPLLFHRTIRENIAYGKLDATDAEIVRAATLAQADGFIERLPQKYETMVGERGVKLSGGERQRIALARAILKPSKVLLLDEATSALDSESEAAIQKALHVLMEGKTVIAIAHRLSTLREMDRLLVLDKGKIIEDGTHDELIKKGGLYAELWSHQSGGYIQDEA
jgi:ABC-type multidrug transport system fused ATPase/permease subunit